MKIRIKHLEDYNRLVVGTKSKAKDFKNAYNEKFATWVSFGFADRKIVYMEIDGIDQVSPFLFDDDKDALTNPLFVAFKNWQSKQTTFK